MGGSCICCDGLQFKSAMADGADEVRKAAREQMRQGADHVKIMMSGGVASPYDPLDSLQFSEGEVEAAVQEAHAFGRYVCAHAYTPEAITRAAKGGVRTIEHGNLIDAKSAKLLKATGQGKRVDELVTAMNRAAEAAVPQAKTLLVSAVKSMSVDDAVKIVRELGPIIGGGYRMARDLAVTRAMLQPSPNLANAKIGRAHV